MTPSDFVKAQLALWRLQRAVQELRAACVSRYWQKAPSFTNVRLTNEVPPPVERNHEWSWAK